MTSACEVVAGAFFSEEGTNQRWAAERHLTCSVHAVGRTSTVQQYDGSSSTTEEGAAGELGTDACQT
jgi:hypothetical protein